MSCLFQWCHGLIIVCGLWLAGCGVYETPQLKMFRENQGKQLDLSGLYQASVLYADSTIATFGELMKRYPYLSLTYLDEECDVCQVKLSEWNKYSDQLPQAVGLAYVMIFRGADFDTFRKMSLHRDSLFSGCVVVLDPQKRFVIDNATVPYELLDNTILVDSLARMLLFGAPFVTPAMQRLYLQRVDRHCDVSNVP